jgi:hypothetical protein
LLSLSLLLLLALALLTGAVVLLRVRSAWRSRE